MRNRSERLLGYAFVAAQSALFVVIFAPRRRRPGVQPPARRSVALRATAGLAIGTGAVVAVAGARELGADLTPMPLPREGSRLRTGGAYAVVRHPVYTGAMAASAVRGLTAGGRVRPAAAAALCALLVVKAGWEERQLRARFPDYPAYARRTPRFVPRLRAR
ncbi:methyltransferase family protein [Actinoplanes sp. NPDC049599]|uniref:methyltransferase family protein n=1 Tax=Actinoplanes sp. NPDC049599 TaxID=3363903 RepID=UPI00378E808B